MLVCPLSKSRWQAIVTIFLLFFLCFFWAFDGYHQSFRLMRVFNRHTTRQGWYECDMRHDIMCGIGGCGWRESDTVGVRIRWWLCSTHGIAYDVILPYHLTSYYLYFWSVYSSLIITIHSAGDNSWNIINRKQSSSREGLAIGALVSDTECNSITSANI